MIKLRTVVILAVVTSRLAVKLMNYAKWKIVCTPHCATCLQ